MIDGVLRAALRAGCYQLFFLSRVPAHAVVDEMVRVVRAERGQALAGVANAVLRKLAKQAEVELAEPGWQRPSGVIVPPWASEAFVRALGEARSAAWLGSGNAALPLVLRVRAPHRSHSRHGDSHNYHGDQQTDVRESSVRRKGHYVRSASHGFTS